MVSLFLDVNYFPITGRGSNRDWQNVSTRRLFMKKWPNWQCWNLYYVPDNISVNNFHVWANYLIRIQHSDNFRPKIHFRIWLSGFSLAWKFPYCQFTNITSDIDIIVHLLKSNHGASRFRKENNIGFKISQQCYNYKWRGKYSMNIIMSRHR